MLHRRGATITLPSYYSIRHGAVGHLLDGDGSALLHLASQGGHYDVVELLLGHGADANSLNSDGWTPLRLASQRSHD
jgi:ankyrin repeat protein